MALLFKVWVFSNGYLNYCICLFQGFKTNSKVSTTDHVVLSDVTQFGLSGHSFRLDGFHFHAGKFNNAKGSEHSFDGEFQPMEVTIVFH